MPMVLMDYVTSKSGSWASAASANIVELTQLDDAVVFQGPLSLNVAVVAESVLTPVGGGNARSSTSDLYSYDVEVPAGFTWCYQMADSPAGLRVSGFKVQIRPAPCAPRVPVQAPDLPCDYAVGSIANVGQFFPVACEPCGAGPVRLPPTCGPSLVVTPAAGGCVRPRFFNGMFITREDLETQLRYLRLKNQLQRRADGEGVVWGLGLGRDGGAICVQPGYGVDCCGNDLTVTSVYRVESATLLSDPAICNLITGRQQCLSLVLEYVECPEQPRPVHGGDACCNTAPGCEMSRVRETVRLRLLPPRPYQPKGPIQRFLDSISQGAASAPGTITNNTGATSNTGTTSSVGQFPFAIAITAPSAGSTLTSAGASAAVASITLQPSTTAAASTQPFVLAGGSVLAITMPPPGGAYVMSGGSVQTTSSSPAGAMTAANVSVPSGGATQPIAWQLDTAGLPNGLATTVYTVQNWTAPAGAAAQDGSYSGSTTVTVAAYRYEEAAASSVYFQVSVAPSPVTLTLPPPAPFPCLTDPCCGATALFPVTPPWADANPFKPTQEGDLGVILLAVSYVLMVGASAQNSSNVASYRQLYESIARLVDPNATSLAALNQETLAVQELLADLCCSLLYPGPVCEGEPHGVVIGCATVTGREIERVDPWSGRRWVMHYPLWSYWGAQFGLVPADVLASRMFSFVCCVAGLKSSVVGSPVTRYAGIAQDLDLGAGRLTLNAADAGTATETASLPVFAARALSALAGQPAPQGTPMIDVALAGNPAIRLLVPNTTARAATPAISTTAPAATSAAATQTGFTENELRTAAPPLLRDFAASLATKLTASLPLETLNPPTAVLAPLLVSGVGSVGALLSQTPQSLYTTVLGKTKAAELSELISSAEAKPAEVARAVTAALKATAAKQALVTPNDLATADAQAALAEPLAGALHLPPATVTAAIAAALG